MSLVELLRVVGERWRTAGTALLVCIAASVGVTALVPPTFSATAQLFVAVKSDRTAGDLAQGGSFSTQRVKSYPDLVASPLVLDPVIEDFGLDMRASQLAAKVFADVPPETVLVNITVQDRSAVDAANLANAISEQFAEVVEELEQTESTKASPVRVSVVRPADTPQRPISPRPILNLVYGLLAGLVLGVGAAVVRYSFDTTFQTELDLQENLGLAPLGVVPYDATAARNPIIPTGDEYSVRAETYRQIRTNLQFVDVDSPPRTVVLTSAVPREGKTLTSINLALTLTKSGMRVCLIDADLRRPTVHSVLGLVGDAGLTTILAGRASRQEVTQHYDDRLDVITSGRIPPNPAELLGSRARGELLASLGSDYDMILIDSPPLLPVTDAAVLSAHADGVALVVRARSTRHEQVRAAVDALRSVDTNVLGAILNMGKARRGRSDTYQYEYHSRRG